MLSLIKIKRFPGEPTFKCDGKSWVVSQEYEGKCMWELPVVDMTRAAAITLWNAQARSFNESFEEEDKKRSEKLRGFELVKSTLRLADGFYKLPERGTVGSAGYDFYLPHDVTIEPHQATEIIWSGIKAYMQQDEVLLLDMRSSMGHKGLRLGFTIGVIDSDYYGNPQTDGNIGFKLVNDTKEPITLKAGERIVQGIFTKFLIADNDNCVTKRTGGYGSTGK